MVSTSDKYSVKAHLDYQISTVTKLIIMWLEINYNQPENSQANQQRQQ